MNIDAALVAVKWKAEPAEHNYPAAVDNLALGLPEKQAEQLVAALRKAPRCRRRPRTWSVRADFQCCQRTTRTWRPTSKRSR